MEHSLRKEYVLWKLEGALMLPFVKTSASTLALWKSSLTCLYKADLLLCESGGDNLAANFSRELADYIIYVIDVCGGDKIPPRGGPQADLLVINKTDLAPAVGADLAAMERDALRIRLFV
ncbi:hypothetical protein SAY86_010807 [Trapa natans]|uniref:CobW/HypB/UreG nucleotide-binding domain-containing protein n=1 Tax=Trapa natans TaxID=22666 RepID=A0AAN7LM86_TRANT|nr:hypothetical protein SAY86_010807 [Trapa natans]